MLQFCSDGKINLIYHYITETIPKKLKDRVTKKLIVKEWENQFI